MVELELVWAIVVSIALGVVAIFLLRLQRKHNADMQSLIDKHKDTQKKTMVLGKNMVRGELNEILGTFKLLNEYEQLALVTGATSPSIDLLGIKDDSLDFIEVKSLDTPLSKPERNVKKLIEDHKVRYVILEGNIPRFFEIKERE